VGDTWVGIVWACILIFVWLRGKIRVGEWCCEVVGGCEVHLSCEVWCSTSSQPDENLYVCVCGMCIRGMRVRGMRICGMRVRLELSAVWNSLPAHLRSTLISRRQFRDGLKSHLFTEAYF